MAYKPILFNTEMVQAIQADRKTQTRRIVKDFAGETITSILKPDGSFGKYGTKGWRGMLPDRGDGNEYCIEVRPPCEPGDILWVRETWSHGYIRSLPNSKGADTRWWEPTLVGRKGSFAYRAEAGPLGEVLCISWKPSIHMPKQAARIFLRVKDVRVERLTDITDKDAASEGVPDGSDYPVNPVYCPICNGTGTIGTHHPDTLGYMDVDCPECDTPTKRFEHLWDSTIKPADLDKYGWNANPWVWVIEFERCDRPEGWCTA